MHSRTLSIGAYSFTDLCMIYNYQKILKGELVSIKSYINIRLLTL